MYNIDDIGGLFSSLPPNLQSIENKCYLYAIDRQLQKLCKLVRQLNIWGDFDSVNPRYYDYIAMSMQAPYYRSEYGDDQKLKLLKTALLTYRNAGTVKAIEELLKSIFGDAQFIPWYEYGGEAYHFKILATKVPSQSDNALFTAILKKVKAARSILDYVEIIENDEISYLYIGTAMTIEKEMDIQFINDKEVVS